MRTNDPGLMSQLIFERAAGSKMKVQQHVGVYVGQITETHFTNPSIPEGQVKFSIPSLSGDAGWSPAPAPGRGNPPVGTQCVVSFEGMTSDSPRILGFLNWQSSPQSFYKSTDPSTTNVTLLPGDIWIQP